MFANLARHRCHKMTHPFDWGMEIGVDGDNSCSAKASTDVLTFPNTFTLTSEALGKPTQRMASVLTNPSLSLASLFKFSFFFIAFDIAFGHNKDEIPAILFEIQPLENAFDILSDALPHSITTDDNQYRIHLLNIGADSILDYINDLLFTPFCVTQSNCISYHDFALLSTDDAFPTNKIDFLGDRTQTFVRFTDLRIEDHVDETRFANSSWSNHQDVMCIFFIIQIIFDVCRTEINFVEIVDFRSLLFRYDG